MKKVLYILGTLSDEDIEWILKVGEKRVFSPGSALVTEGQPTTAIYITLLGRLSVTSKEAGGKEIDNLGPGEIVGEMSFVDSLPPSATVRAEEEATVLAISRAVLGRQLQADNGFAARFYRALAIFLSDRLRNVISQVNPQPDDGGFDEQSIEEDELDPNVLDGVYLAGLRFERILQRMLYSAK